jgi:hypothetical protein
MKELIVRIVRLLKSGELTGDTKKSPVLFTTRRFKPNCMRNQSVSQNSNFLPKSALRKKARWSKKVKWSINSEQPSTYPNIRASDDLNNATSSQWHNLRR